MTSELLIMTSSAIALAADSAVTVGNKKIYNGVNKLFMLSNNPPIGIMIFNNANFLNIPFETIIKEFRHYTLERGFSTLKEFQEEFKYFLKLIIPKSNFKSNLTDLIESFVEKMKKDSQIFSDDDFYNQVKKIVSLFNEDMINEIYVEICEDLNENKHLFNDLIPDFQDSLMKKDLLDNLIKFFINQQFIMDFTGIVMAGFETEKLFPSAIEFKVIYLYGDKFILNDIKEQEVGQNEGEGETAVIVKPFAQGDVITTFLTSIDDSTKLEISSFFKEINTKYMDKFKVQISNNSNFSKEVKEEIFNEIGVFEDEKKGLPLQFDQFINELIIKNTNPILTSIGALPYDELSNLSESLIKVTSLKRKVQSDLESVGGDVDVAIITKGDGFVWTKRKHYFDAEFNYQFFER